MGHPLTQAVCQVVGAEMLERFWSLISCYLSIYIYIYLHIHIYIYTYPKESRHLPRVGLMVSIPSPE